MFRFKQEGLGKMNDNKVKDKALKTQNVLSEGMDYMKQMKLQGMYQPFGGSIQK
jgi:hypothetical protein